MALPDRLGKRRIFIVSDVASLTAWTWLDQNGLNPALAVASAPWSSGLVDSSSICDAPGSALALT